jgi:hypothetical protein
MPGIDTDGEQRVALQVRGLPVGVRRHAHVANQHRRITTKNKFPYGSAWRYGFPHNFEATWRLAQATVADMS